MKVLIQALQATGRDVRQLDGARDECGEDGLLEVDGLEVGVQIRLCLPVNSQVGSELATRGASSPSGDQPEAVRWIREALKQKANTARGTLLALDASHFGAIVGPNLVDAYFSRYRNPEDEFKFKEVWIIGPTVRSSARLKPTD